MGKQNANKQEANASRKELVLGPKKNYKLWGGIIVLACVAVAFATFMLLKGGRSGAGDITASQVMDKVDYGQGTLAMTPIEAVLADGNLEIPLDVVKDKKIVFFTYAKPGGQFPMMAYITPSGKLVTAVSVCEPCKSTKFHIEGDNMVCNACFTRWDLESLQGISGGCTAYPPDVIAHKIEGGKIRIKETDILNWQPRV